MITIFDDKFQTKFDDAQNSLSDSCAAVYSRNGCFNTLNNDKKKVQSNTSYLSDRVSSHKYCVTNTNDLDIVLYNIVDARV